MIRIALLMLMAPVALAGCAPMAGDAGPGDAAASRRQCFFTSTVNSFRDGPDRDTVFVRVGTRDEYELAPVGACQDIGWARGIQLQPSIGQGSSICVGDLADVRLAGATVMPNQCQVRVTRKLEQPGGAPDAR